MKLLDALATSGTHTAVATMASDRRYTIIAGPAYEEPAAGVSPAYTACRFSLLFNGTPGDGSQHVVAGWPLVDVEALAAPGRWLALNDIQYEDSGCIF